MARKTARSRTRATRRTHYIPLPHPSWRLHGTGAAPSATITQASDFWERLGL